MWRSLLVGMLFTPALIDPLSAQNRDEPNASGPTDVSYQWNYSCPNKEECSFTCGTGGGSHVTKLNIYVGGVPIAAGQKNATLSYEFTTREGRRGSGFSINTGISTLQCQVNGLTVDYSGPPRGNDRT